MKRWIRLPKFGGIFLSLLVHVIAFALVAGWVVSRAPAKRGAFVAENQVVFDSLVEDEPVVPQEAMDSPDAASEVGTGTGTGESGADVSDLIVANTPMAAYMLPAAVFSTASAAWGGGGQGGGKGNGRGAPAVHKIFGASVRASHIAVVLDCSGSMEKYLGNVIQEIRRQFPQAEMIGVSGSGTYGAGGWAQAAYPSTLDSVGRQNNVADAESLVRVMGLLPDELKGNVVWAQGGPVGAICYAADQPKIDAVYWFADFWDPVDAEVVSQLKAILLKKKVALYVHSTDKAPAPSISEAAAASGGAVIMSPVAYGASLRR